MNIVYRIEANFKESQVTFFENNLKSKMFWWNCLCGSKELQQSGKKLLSEFKATGTRADDF